MNNFPGIQSCPCFLIEEKKEIRQKLEFIINEMIRSDHYLGEDSDSMVVKRPKQQEWITRLSLIVNSLAT